MQRDTEEVQSVWIIALGIVILFFVPVQCLMLVKVVIEICIFDIAFCNLLKCLHFPVRVCDFGW